MGASFSRLFRHIYQLKVRDIFCRAWLLLSEAGPHNYNPSLAKFRGSVGVTADRDLYLCLFNPARPAGSGDVSTEGGGEEGYPIWLDEMSCSALLCGVVGKMFAYVTMSPLQSNVCTRVENAPSERKLEFCSKDL